MFSDTNTDLIMKQVSFGDIKVDAISSCRKAAQEGETKKLLGTFQSDDVEEFERIIFKSPNFLKHSGKHGKETSLHTAARLNAIKIGQFLLEKKLIDANHQADEIELSCTPLYHAIKTGSQEMVTLLMQHGAHHYPLNSLYDSSVYTAVLFQQEDILSIILNNDASIVNTPSKQTPFPMPLSSAVRHGNITLVTLLLDHGADVFLKDKNGGDTLFHDFVMCSRNETILRTILKHGYTMNHELNDETAFAALLREESTLPLLTVILDYTDMTSAAGAWLLKMAVTYQQYAFIRNIISRGFDVNSSIVTKCSEPNGLSLLQTAFHTVDIDIMKSLIDSRIDLNKHNISLQWLIEQCRHKSEQLLECVNDVVSDISDLEEPLTSLDLSDGRQSYQALKKFTSEIITFEKYVCHCIDMCMHSWRDDSNTLTLTQALYMASSAGLVYILIELLRQGAPSPITYNHVYSVHSESNSDENNVEEKTKVLKEVLMLFHKTKHVPWQNVRFAQVVICLLLFTPSLPKLALHQSSEQDFLGGRDSRDKEEDHHFQEQIIEALVVFKQITPPSLCSICRSILLQHTCKNTGKKYIVSKSIPITLTNFLNLEDIKSANKDFIGTFTALRNIPEMFKLDVSNCSQENMLHSLADDGQMGFVFKNSFKI